MPNEVSTASDSSLLRCWSEERSQSAFAELVRRYERLVMGAALRRAAGDRELARDVTQQVFAMVAAKGRLLASCPSLAGWLYRAAGHVAAQLLRSDARRAARHRSAVPALVGSPAPAADERWGILEDALSELASPDRDALVLHYFRDLSYPEMASELGIAEAAARKRVSRGLQKLGAALRKHGLGSPKALLAGAAALQAVQPANAALAAGAIAGTSTISTPLPLLFSALMSQLPLKIAVCAASLALLPLGYQWTANASLRAELAEQQARPPLPQQDPSLSAASPSMNTDLAAVRAELARVEVATKVAQARAAELSHFKDKQKDELIVSLGSIEAMAKELGTTLRQMTELKNARVDTANRPPGSPEWQKREAALRKIEAGVPKLFSVLRELPRLEREPAKAARFYATLVGETAGLDDATRAKLEPRLQEWVSRLQRDFLALPQRPREPEDAIADWDKRRIAAMQEISKELQTLVPPAQSEGASLFRALMMEPDATKAREPFDLITGEKK